MANLLPSSKNINAIVKRTNIASSLSSGKGDKSKASSSILQDVSIIKVKVIKIDKLLKDNFALKQKLLKQKSDLLKRQSFQRREEQLEKKDEKVKKDDKETSTPKIGFLERIKRFILFTLLGFIGNKLFKHIPAILDFISKINPVIKTIETIVGALFDGFATFIDLGYKAYDTVRGFAKNLGGEPFLKVFDQFSSALNTFINLAIIVGMSTMGGTDFGFGRGKGGPGGAKGGRPRVTTSGGKPAGRPDIRNPLRRRPTVTQGRGGGNFIQRLFGKAKGFKLPQVKLPKVPGLSQVGNALGPLKKLGKIGKIVPGLATVIGVTEGLFRLSEGDYTGALLSFGSAIPIAGWGFLAIDIAREMMGKKSFDSAVGGAFGGTPGLTDKQREQRVPTQGRSALESSLTTMSGPSIVTGLSGGGLVGGVTTRGGQTVSGSVGRSERKVVKRGEELPQKVEVEPGKSVGGEEKFKTLFPQSKKKDNASPYDYLANSANKMADVKYLGPLFGIVTKIMLGQSPSKSDYKNAGIGLNAFIQSGLNSGGLKGSVTSGYAEGGSVEAIRLSGDNISLWAEKTVESLVDSKVSHLRRDLFDQLRLRKEEIKSINNIKSEDDKGYSDPSLETGPGGTVTGGNADFWSLVAIASLESGNAQGRADVAQSIYNRLASGIYGGKSIKELIVSGNGRQYQPVGRAVSEFKAISDKASAINAVMVANKLNKSQAEKFINDTASAIQNKDLQKSAAEFVGGRTDFWAQSLNPPANGVGYVVRHGHRFGWFAGPGSIAYGKKNPGPAKAPALGDIVVMGTGPGGGKMAAGGKTIVEIGKSLLKQGFKVDEHPDFTKGVGYTPGKGIVEPVHKGRGHYEGRAIDVTDFRGSLEDSKARYRSVLNSLYANRKSQNINMLIHDSWGAMYGAGAPKQGPGGHGHPTHMHVETTGKQGGGLIGEKSVNSPSVNSYASYNSPGGRSTTYVQTIYVEKPSPMQPPRRGTTSFPGDSMVNNNAVQKKAALTRG